ncbi:MAG: cobalamin biosynthesis protein [Sphingomonadaceae bacterium]|nr:cobalamin biosynthesis protein [Sphingomonadaceae bacterium]
MIVAGFGFREGATLASFAAALAGAQGGCPPVTLLAAPKDKAAALKPLAVSLDLDLATISRDRLRGMDTPTVSPASLKAYGVGSVAEAAALAAAGPGAILLCARFISPDRMATCAIATGTAT